MSHTETRSWHASFRTPWEAMPRLSWSPMWSVDTITVGNQFRVHYCYDMYIHTCMVIGACWLQLWWNADDIEVGVFPKLKCVYVWPACIILFRYANRAKNIKNKPHINEDPKDALLREYQEEITRLKMALEKRKKGGGGDKQRRRRVNAQGEGVCIYHACA